MSLDFSSQGNTSQLVVSFTQVLKIMPGVDICENPTPKGYSLYQNELVYFAALSPDLVEGKRVSPNYAARHCTVVYQLQYRHLAARKFQGLGLGARLRDPLLVVLLS